jgi:pimeloyl-ACP methyl ester carboxylesterase
MAIAKLRERMQSQSVLKLLATIVGAGAVIGVVVPLLLVVTQRWSVVRVRERYPAPGRILDVGGHTMHLFCDGESEDGDPTVVIDADNANFSLDWVGIQRELISTQRVCVYDRAGYGWSQPVAGPRTAETIVLELHALLQAAGEPGPYVLVGHGLGGVYAQLYAARFTDDLAGMVLVDPTTEVALTEAYSRQWRLELDFYELMRGVTATGLLRFVRPLLGATPPWVNSLPSDVRKAYLALVLDRAYYETAIGETEMLAVSLDQVDAAFWGDAPLEGLPLVVLTASHMAAVDAKPYKELTTPTDAEVVTAHRAVAALSLVGERRMLGRSGPHVQLDAPGAVVAAIRDVSAMATVGQSQ